MTHAPRIWPQVVVEAGPTIAGVGPGDAFAFAPDDELWLTQARWLGSRRGRESDAAPRMALQVRAADGWTSTGVAWRVSSSPPQLESAPARVPGSPEARRWRAHTSDIVHIGAWRLRFVLDGPPLATSKRFGDHVAVHLHRLWLDGGRETGALTSTWVLPQDGARSLLVVEESHGGDVGWRVEPRRPGVRVDQLRHATGAPLDAEVAKGIVTQLAEAEGGVVGWDGVVGTTGGWPSAMPASSWFAQLSGQSRDAFATTRAATPAEIGAVLRALFPAAWAREQALVEECAVVAG